MTKTSVGILLMLASIPAIIIGILFLSVGIEWFEIGFAVMNERG